MTKIHHQVLREREREREFVLKEERSKRVLSMLTWSVFQEAEGRKHEAEAKLFPR